jgi:hypothetical protein
VAAKASAKGGEMGHDPVRSGATTQGLCKGNPSAQRLQGQKGAHFLQPLVRGGLKRITDLSATFSSTSRNDKRSSSHSIRLLFTFVPKTFSWKFFVHQKAFGKLDRFSPVGSFPFGWVMQQIHQKEMIQVLHKTRKNLLLCILKRAKRKSFHKDDSLSKNVSEPKTATAQLPNQPSRTIL